MGCDIHAVVERKVGEKWIAVNVIQNHYTAGRDHDGETDGFSSPAALDRNYARFAAMAGVRGSGPIPKGVPEDPSQTTAHLIKSDIDGHSHSWLPLDEAIKIMANTEQWRAHEDEKCWIRQYPSHFFFNVEDDQLDDHRLVFWFDN